MSSSQTRSTNLNLQYLRRALSQLLLYPYMHYQPTVNPYTTASRNCTSALTCLPASDFALRPSHTNGKLSALTSKAVICSAENPSTTALLVGSTSATLTYAWQPSSHPPASNGPTSEEVGYASRDGARQRQLFVLVGVRARYSTAQIVQGSK